MEKKTKEELLNEREDIVKEWQKIYTSTEPEDQKRVKELNNRIAEIEKELGEQEEMIELIEEVPGGPGGEGKPKKIVVLRKISASPLLPWFIVAVLAVFGFFSTIGWVGGYRRVKELKTDVANMTQAVKDAHKEAKAAEDEAKKALKAKEDAETKAEVKVKELEEALKVAKAAVPAVAAAPAPTPAPTAPAPTPAPVAPTVPVAPATPAVPAVPPVKAVPAKEVPEALKLAIVEKDEGIEHALIRQLIFVPELYGFKGDTGDKKAVKKWAQTKAHQIAILAGYVDLKTGSEVRVKGPGGNVAYVLQTDSGLKLSVAQSCKDKEGNFPDSGSKLVKTLELAKDYQSATFQGNIDVQSYEYLYFKVEGK